jgi:hypothetical protein
MVKDTSRREADEQGTGDEFMVHSSGLISTFIMTEKS